MATIEGAKVLGIDDKTGSIEAGKRADIIIMDMKNPTLRLFTTLIPLSSIQRQGRMFQRQLSTGRSSCRIAVSLPWISGTLWKR